MTPGPFLRRAKKQGFILHKTVVFWVVVFGRKLVSVLTLQQGWAGEASEMDGVAKQGVAGRRNRAPAATMLRTPCMRNYPRQPARCQNKN